MSNVGTIEKRIPQVRYNDELQGKLGEKIKEVMKRRAMRGEIMSYRAAILDLINIGAEKELNINQ